MFTPLFVWPRFFYPFEASHPRIQIIKGIRIPALRFRLFGIFSASVITTIASVVHAVALIDELGVLNPILGTTVLVSPNVHSPRMYFSAGGVEAAVSVMVCSMSVIIPAILRALGVGDPFMQTDTVDPGFSSGVEIVRMSMTGVELGLATTHVVDVAGSDEHEEATGAVTPRKSQSLAGSEAMDDQKRRLATQVSDGSLGTSVMTKVASRADEHDIADSLPTIT
jgi:hypothetical protein